jgi:hypothetical protein
MESEKLRLKMEKNKKKILLLSYLGILICLTLLINSIMLPTIVTALQTIPDVSSLSADIENAVATADQWTNYNPSGQWYGEVSPGYGYGWVRYDKTAKFSWGGSILGFGTNWYGIAFQSNGGVSRVPQIVPMNTDAKAALSYKPVQSGRFTISPNPNYTTINLGAAGSIPSGDAAKTSKFAIYRNETMIWPANGMPLQLSKNSPSAAFPTLQVNLSTTDTLRFVIENKDQTGLYGYNACMNLYPVITETSFTSAYSIASANNQSAIIEANTLVDQWYSYTQTSPWKAEYYENSLWNAYNQAAEFSWGASIIGRGETWYGMVFQPYKGVSRVPNPTPSGSTAKISLSFKPTQSGLHSIGPDALYTTIDLMNASSISSGDADKTAKFAIYKNDTIIWPRNSIPLGLSKNSPIAQFPSLDLTLDTTDTVRFVVDCTDTSGLTGWLAALAFFPEVKCVSTTNFTRNTISTWYEGALNDVFTDTVQSSNSLADGTISMAKNESESIQVALRCDSQDLTGASVSVDAISGSNVPTVTVKPVRNIYNSKSSYGIREEWNRSAGYVRTLSPGYIPAYYDNTTTIGTITAGKTQSILVEATSLASTTAGTYNTNVRINTNLGQTVVPVTIVVYNATIPDAKDSSLAYNAYFNSATSSRAAQYMEKTTSLNTIYNMTSYSSNFWTLMQNYASVMKKQRQNTIRVPVEALLLPDMTIDLSGNYTFDWTKFDQFVNTFISYGSVKYLDSDYPYEKDWYINQNPNTELAAWVFKRQPDGKASSVWKLVETNSAEVNSHIDKLYTALYAHLQTNGWINMWLQHAADEPYTQVQFNEMTALYNRLKGINSSIKTIDPGSEQNTRFGTELNIPVPQIDSYENNKSAFDTINNTAGRQLWTYTCVNPQGNWMTRVGDYPLQSTRMIGWYMYQNNLKGYLHWSWNSYYKSVNNPNNPYADMYCQDAVEDAWLVYPDATNLTVKEGPRSTAVRDGFEDYEILKLAYDVDSNYTASTVKTMVLSGQIFNRSTKELLSNRLELLKIAAGNPINFSLDKTSMSIGKGVSKFLIANYNNLVLGENDLIWSSDNITVATVESNGKISGINTGSATITVSTKNGAYMASCTITVTSYDSSTYYKISYEPNPDIVIDTALSSPGSLVTNNTNNSTSISQQWQITEISSGVYKIINRESGLSLDVADGVNTVGKSLIQSVYAASNRMQWDISDFTTYVKIRSKLGTNTFIQGNGIAGSNLTTTNSSSSLTSQRWTISPVQANFGTYRVSNTNKVTNISPRTTIKDIKNAVTLRNGVALSANQDVNNQVGTGTRIDLTENQVVTSFETIIYGDVDGDGDIAISDLAAMKMHLLKATLLADNYYIAGCVLHTGKISIIDLLAIKKSLLGLFTIDQNH